VTDMKKASDIFGEDSRREIRQAVAEAEKSTGGEIVPVVATASGRYDRAEDIFGFLVSLAGLSAAWMIFARSGEAGDWDSSMTTQLPLWGALILLLVLFSSGAALATLFPSLRLPFITRKEMTNEVDQAAAAAFYNFRAHGTASRAGALIYVSLYERMARVIVDDAVAQKVAPETWAGVVGLVTDAMAAGAPADGMAAAIARCGEILSGPFPRPDDDTNEISNELRIVD